jgi:hypothetical protein
MGPLRLFWNPHTDDGIEFQNTRLIHKGGKSVVLNRTRRNKKHIN